MDLASCCSGHPEGSLNQSQGGLQASSLPEAWVKAEILVREAMMISYSFH